MENITASALKLKGISKTYGQGEFSVQALKNVDLDFRKNEFVSILGPSGCGKTTLLNIVGGLDRYTSGDLIINGVSTKEYKDNDWDAYRNNSIGFVFQSYNLIPHQTALANVELSLTLSGVSKHERKKRAKEVLKKVGLKGLEHKLPNQMSGGQMQRVAIARALINDPDIILADEPTGALDTETSIQVMELLKEVAKDRLVIMVTHNPELAKTYSTRIINLLDGEVKGDTNPYIEDKKINEKPAKKHRSAMKFSTAFSLSLSNLRTKKGRTTLTSIAGSIGIIGIALVLALSTGFSAYIQRLQADTLSVYPITISEATVDLSDFENLTNKNVSDEVLAQKLKETVYTNQMFGNLTNMLKSNRLTKNYVQDYVEKFIDEKNELAKDTESKWSYCVKKGYGFDVNHYIYSNIDFLGMKYTMPVDQLVNNLENMFDQGMQKTDMNISAGFVREYIPTVSEIPDNLNLLQSQYDLLKGDWAQNEDELLLVVDDYNRVSDITLALLGFNSLDGMDTEKYNLTFGKNTEFNFSDVIGKEFYYLKNDTRYVKNADGTFYDRTFIPDNDLTKITPDMTLKIKGIVRLKDTTSDGVLSTGIAYTSKFVEKILTDNINSQIALTANADVNKSAKVYSWYTFDPVMLALISSVPAESQEMIKGMQLQKTYNLRQVAGNSTVSKLSIFSVGYEAKEEIKTYLKAWNDVSGRVEEDKVHFSDPTETLFMALNTVVDSVKIVLICFTAISLVVSSIMIGIITYVSVVERTKEIGILRSLGARKKDISRIFNAETFLIGLFAGIIGVLTTYLLSIPINLLINFLVPNAGNVAALKITDALVLVGISFALTLIAGVIPARIAAKKDPVIALRTE